MAGGDVVVWQWLTDEGFWHPYTPQVSNYIETANTQGTSKVCLGTADATMSMYAVDLAASMQTRTSTGQSRPVRRVQVSGASCLAKGVSWEWGNDRGTAWHAYTPMVADLLEQHWAARTQALDLSTTPCGMPYTIDFASMMQKRNNTGTQRPIKRWQLTQKYSPAAQPPSSGAASSTTSTASTSSAAGMAPLTSTATGVVPFSSTAPGVRPFISTAPGVTPFSSTAVGVLPTGSTAMLGMPMANGSAVIPSGISSAPPPPGGALAAARRYMTRQFLRIAGHTSQGPVVPPSGPPAASALSGPSGMVSRSGGLPAGVPQVATTMAPQAAHVATQQLASSSTTGHQVAAGSRPNRKFSSNHPRKRARITSSHQNLEVPADNTVTFDETVENYVDVCDQPPQNEDCSICVESLAGSSGYSDNSEVYQLSKCSHMFHRDCLQAMYDSGPKHGSFQCPTCKCIYGVKYGNCPPGRMDVRSLQDSLPGYDCGTIMVLYFIPPGTQQAGHPNPGAPYTARGFPRVGYFPDNPQGRKIVELLKVAWKRRLIFTIGHSATTGEPNTVVWNEIHHKTEFGSNHSGHGYPDPNYLDNVLYELALQGVTDDEDQVG